MRKIFLILFIIIYNYSNSYAGFDMGKLDTAGNNFLYMAQSIGYWIVTIKCVLDIMKCALNKDKGAVGDTIVTYSLIYGAMFFVPFILNLIKGVF